MLFSAPFSEKYPCDDAHSSVVLVVYGVFHPTSVCLSSKSIPVMTPTLCLFLLFSGSFFLQVYTRIRVYAYTHTHTHTHSFLLQGTTQPSTNAVEVQRNSHNFCLQGTSTPSGRLRPHHHRLFNPSSCHLGRTKHCAFSTITPRPVASAPRHVHTSRSKSGPGSWTIDATQSKEPSPLCTGMLESIVRSNNKS